MRQVTTLSTWLKFGGRVPDLLRLQLEVFEQGQQLRGVLGDLGQLLLVGEPRQVLGHALNRHVAGAEAVLRRIELGQHLGVVVRGSSSGSGLGLGRRLLGRLGLNGSGGGSNLLALALGRRIRRLGRLDNLLFSLVLPRR